MKISFICVIYIISQIAVVFSSFDTTTNKMAYTLSAAAYCPTTNYTTQALPSPATSFKMLSVIDDNRSDTQGFIGVNIATRQIFIVYRGSESIQDWFNDLDRITAAYAATACSDCNVLSGIYKAYTFSRTVVWTAMESARSSYPTYEIVVTGHSLGAALATLLSLDMHENGITNRLFNYGSPRIGDSNWAIYASKKLGNTIV